MAGGPSAGKRAGGVAMMLLGVALIGYGTHYVAKNGNCSSTGYVSYGPVPKCSGGEALYIMSVFFLGPGLALVGWLFAQISGVLWPAVCLSAGAALIALRFDAAPGTQAFGLAAGIVFVALAVLSVARTVRKRLRPKPVGPPAGLAGAHVGGTAAGGPSAPVRPLPDGPQRVSLRPATSPGPDPLDRIAKLAQLRDSGALTEEEFEAQKAKLLAEM